MHTEERKINKTNYKKKKVLYAVLSWQILDCCAHYINRHIILQFRNITVITIKIPHCK